MILLSMYMWARPWSSSLCNLKIRDSIAMRSVHSALIGAIISFGGQRQRLLRFIQGPSSLHPMSGVLNLWPSRQCCTPIPIRPSQHGQNFGHYGNSCPATSGEPKVSSPCPIKIAGVGRNDPEFDHRSYMPSYCPRFLSGLGHRADNLFFETCF